MPRKQVTERDEKILKMWNENMTGTEIGAVLGTTRNAILGRLHRLKAYGIDTSKSRPARVTPQRPKTPRVKVAKKETPKPKTEKIYYPPRIEEQPISGVTLLQLKPKSCRFIISHEDANVRIFCGKNKERGAYCGNHARLCYLPPKEKKTEKSNESTNYKYGSLPQSA
jgi:hypothetical protein